MSKILKRIEYQIKRDGKLPEHLEVLKLYNAMINHKLSSSLLWSLLTDLTFDKNHNTTYSVKPAFKKLIVEMK